MTEHKRLKYMNLFNEGKKYCSFVAIYYPEYVGILYIWVNTLTECPHTQIFELAVNQKNLNPNIEPVGGGSINSTTCEYLASLHYGEVDKWIEELVRKKALSQC